MDDGHGVRALTTSGQVHQAARVRGDERVDPARPGELLVGHRDRDLGLAHGEGAAEAAAEVGPRQGLDRGPASLEEAARRVGDAELAQHVAGVVVGDRPSLVHAGERRLGLVQEGGELDHAEAAGEPTSFGRWCVTMAAHEPEGTTSGSSGSKARTTERATRLAAAWCPALKAGWPQQIWPRGKTTSKPASRRSRSASDTASGKTRSPRQVAKSCTRPTGETVLAATTAGETDDSHVSVPLISHPGFVDLHPTGSHPESAERIRSLQAAFPDFTEARPATRAEVEACHDPAYLDLLEELTARGETVLLDADTVFTPTSLEAALLAAGAACQAAELGGFALARPPGHHALPGRAMGFCLLANVAVAARFAQRSLGVERVAILDWDVHHGNGTQEIFWDDPSVLFVSLHRWPFYPGSGGPGEGNETTLNVPLEAGAGDAEYAEAMEALVEPAIAGFAPELLLVSAGFDAAEGDPLGGMRVSEDGFRDLARRASALCERVALVLEGGYDPDTLPGLVSATVEGL